MAHIRANRVTRHYSFGRRPSRVLLRLPEPDRQGRSVVTVTAAVRKLELVGLARTRTLPMGQFGGDAPVLLTAAGEKHFEPAPAPDLMAALQSSLKRAREAKP
jgi:hypothetical protein